MKKFLSYFLAFAICATVLSISLYASVQLNNDTAPTTATVAVGGNLTYSIDSIKSWYTAIYETGSATDERDYSISNTVIISASPAPNGNYTANINSASGEFVFTPTLMDVGKSFEFTFNVKGSSVDQIGFPGSDASNIITVTVTGPREATPNADIDFVNEMITGLEYAEYYTINSDPIESDVNGKILIDGDWFGETISIIKNGDYVSTGDSEPQTLVIPDRPGAPSLTPVMASAAGNDGKIIGLDSTKSYTYFYSGGGEFAALGETEISGLEPGVYTFKASAVEDESFLSEIAFVVVPEYPASVDNGLILPDGSGTLWYGNSIYQIPENTPDPILGGGSYNYDSVSKTLTFNNVSFITSSYHALRLQDGPITLNINGTNLIKSTSINIGNAVTGTVTITGTGSLTAEHGRGPVFSDTPTIAMTDYTYESIDGKTIIITYKAPEPVITPEPEPEPDPTNTPNYNAPAPPSPPIVPKTYTIDGGTITLPSNNPKIKTEIRFNSKRTAQTEKYVFDKWGAEALGCFETAQKGGWGSIATITIILKKLGFEAEDGTILYVLIFDTKAKKWYEVEAEVVDGKIVIETEHSGVFVICQSKTRLT